MRTIAHSKSAMVKEDTRPLAEGVVLVSTPYTAARGSGQAGDGGIITVIPCQAAGSVNDGV